MGRRPLPLRGVSEGNAGGQKPKVPLWGVSEGNTGGQKPKVPLWGVSEGNSEGQKPKVFGPICGFDEAGRGPLAGPVCAAAVILPVDFPMELLGDSKKLSSAKREDARRGILKQALAWGIGWASAVEIDRINILRASLLAMERAWEDLILRSPWFLAPSSLRAVVDGLYVPELPIPARALVRADDSVPPVMAASILAKTQRDRLMELYGGVYPEYGYETHKGYPTRAHREALQRHGPSPIQRVSFTVKTVE